MKSTGAGPSCRGTGVCLELVLAAAWQGGLDVGALAHEGRMDMRVGGDASWHILKEQEGFN